nr:PREDICTED: killer cell lectin-like receptor subfamily F member 1 isoform X2 [Struthio camelus australis]
MEDEEGYAKLHFKARKKSSSAEQSSFLQNLRLVPQACGDLQSSDMWKPRENLSESDNTSEDDLHENSLLTALKDNLCMYTNDSRCELCPVGWKLHYGRCYYYSENRDTWKNSKAYCLGKKSELLVIEDEAEMFYNKRKEARRKMCCL